MSKRKELVDLLESLSDDEVEAFEGLLKKAVKSQPKKRRRGRGRRRKKEYEPPQKEEDAFLDGVKLSAAEKAELKEAQQSDKEMGVYRPKQKMPSRTRNPKVEATCRVCGKTQNVSPLVIPPERDRFKCNDCSYKSG